MIFLKCSIFAMNFYVGICLAMRQTHQHNNMKDIYYAKTKTNCIVGISKNV